MKISRALRKNPGALKDLNISYNSLDFNQDKYLFNGTEFIVDDQVNASYVFI
jgi:hypothetical protein